MKKILLLAAMMVAFTFGNFYGSFTGTPAEAQRWDHWVYYDDIRAPATIISTGSGAGTAADRHTDGTLLFATGADEEAFVIMQLPHGYEFASTIEPHVHWGKSTSAGGDVCWAVDWECKDIGETFTNSPATVGLEYVTDDSDTAYKHAYADMASNSFDPACSGVSCVCLFRIWRDVDGGSCSGTPSADDYGADAILYEFDVHIKYDTIGSQSETSK